jgi:hemerythrin HHE cation binding domain-containing protein
MTMHEPRHTDGASLPIRTQLLEEHAALDRALNQIACIADGGDGDELHRAWGELEPLLLRHLAFEERELFPAVEAVHPDWTREFRRDHAEIRRLLAELGVRVDLHALRKQELDELVAALRAHAEEEDATVYRWAEEAAPTDTRRHLWSLLSKTVTAELRSQSARH